MKDSYGRDPMNDSAFTWAWKTVFHDSHLLVFIAGMGVGLLVGLLIAGIHA